MKALNEAVKTMLNALAHEHAGEYLTPSQKTAELSSSPGVRPARVIARPEPVASHVGRRRVALFMGNVLPPSVFDYVFQTCVRLQHDLTVLTFESNTTGEDLLEPYAEELGRAGIDLELVSLGGNTISQLARYLDRHPEIAFLACKESGYLGRSYLTGNQQRHKIPVPVVVIVEREDAGQLHADHNGDARASRS
ncbi:MAG: hypothetical protein R3308_06050, partial [Thiohalobacterales bacterium]|nr:hypothetical protein [Thiohalobacterales bacterium]